MIQDSCANFVAGRMWIIVWSMLGLLIALIWLQVHTNQVEFQVHADL